MILLYRLGLFLYFLLAKTAALWSSKAKKWVEGQHQPLPAGLKDCLWFHFSSLGEFEQGRSVLEALRTHYADMCFVVTFFSPSGYEIRKNTPLADVVLYLPLDSPRSARRFISAITPRAAFFTKYDYWYFYFTELRKRGTPLYLLSAIYRPRQVFFRWYGTLHREMLHCITRVFVQDSRSKDLLDKIGITRVTVSGDTRFDRVLQNASAPKDLPVIEKFVAGADVFVAGSTWPVDEDMLLLWMKSPEAEKYKLIIAPHEVEPKRINELMDKLGRRAVRYSEFSKGLDSAMSSQVPGLRHEVTAIAKRTPHTAVSNPAILVIDNIGLLSSLYRYGKLAYIGGGFGAGIHNTLEAAAFGMPVIFGPQYQKFREAKDLISAGAGFSINSADELASIFSALKDDARLDRASQAAGEYVAGQAGATARIIRELSF